MAEGGERERKRERQRETEVEREGERDRILYLLNNIKWTERWTPTALF